MKTKSARIGPSSGVVGARSEITEFAQTLSGDAPFGNDKDVRQDQEASGLGQIGASTLSARITLRRVHSLAVVSESAEGTM